jgi:hypothetical protein
MLQPISVRPAMGFEGTPSTVKAPALREGCSGWPAGLLGCGRPPAPGSGRGCRSSSCSHPCGPGVPGPCGFGYKVVGTGTQDENLVAECERTSEGRRGSAGTMPAGGGESHTRGGSGRQAEPLAWFGDEELSLADPMESPPLVGTGRCTGQEPTLVPARLSSHRATAGCSQLRFCPEGCFADPRDATTGPRPRRADRTQSP